MNLKISTESKETYILINGLAVNRRVKLSPNIEIIPAKCDPDPDVIVKVSKNEIDLGIITIFLRRVTSQFRVTSDNPKSLAIKSWNTLWDIVLLSAIFNCNAYSYLQCDVPAENIGSSTSLNVLHYHLHNDGSFKARMITEQEAQWLENNFEKASLLLKKPNFKNAVHSMASYQWHPHPRAKMAILWSGIEGLFSIDSELTFRVSLYCARFLSPDDEVRRKTIFSSVKKLYKHRSSAVHGSKIDTNADSAVSESAKLLQSLIMQCIEINELPKPGTLAP